MRHIRRSGCTFIITRARVRATHRKWPANAFEYLINFNCSTTWAERCSSVCTCDTACSQQRFLCVYEYIYIYVIKHSDILKTGWCGESYRIEVCFLEYRDCQTTDCKYRCQMGVSSYYTLNRNRTYTTHTHLEWHCDTFTKWVTCLISPDCSLV